MAAKGSLTPKQERFVQEYLIDLNATQAAARAGYKEPNKQGPRLLVNVGIERAVAAAQNKVAEKLEIKAEYVLTTIHETIERCRQAVPVLDRQGRPVLVDTPSGDLVPAYAFDAKNVLKGAELLGRHLGLFKETLELVNTARLISDKPMSEEEWLSTQVPPEVRPN